MNAVDVRFDDFLDVDIDVAVTGSVSEEEIVDAVQNEGQDGNNIEGEEDECEEVPMPPPVTARQAKSALDTVRAYVEQCGNVPDSVFSAIVNIDNELDVQAMGILRQSKITDFFSKD